MPQKRSAPDATRLAVKVDELLALASEKGFFDEVQGQEGREVQLQVVINTLRLLPPLLAMQRSR